MRARGLRYPGEEEVDRTAQLDPSPTSKELEGIISSGANAAENKSTINKLQNLIRENHSNDSSSSTGSREESKPKKPKKSKERKSKRRRKDGKDKKKKRKKRKSREDGESVASDSAADDDSAQDVHPILQRQKHSLWG